jgi:feruloyl esterase
MNVPAPSFGISLTALVAPFAVLLAAGAFRSQSVSAATCEKLATLALPDTTIALARTEPAGTFTLPKPLDLPGSPLDNLPAFCRVAGEIRPTKDSGIKFEVWMPASGWNGKFMGVGNGGWSGAISYPFMGVALRLGDGLHR